MRSPGGSDSGLPDLLTFAQAVKRLGCRPDSLMAWAELNVIPHTMGADGAPRFERCHVEAFALDGDMPFDSLPS